MNVTDKNKNASLFEEAFFNSTETYIHPSAQVGDNVTLGKGVKIGPSSIVVGNVTIEDNTRIYPHVIIGFPAQVVGLQDSYGTIHIKKNCEIREFVTIHASKYPDGKTIVGNNCYIMNYCHLSHDTILEDNVTLTNGVNLGGHTYVEHNANLMAGCATHQFCRIGKYTALAPFSAIRQDLPPYSLFDGKPAHFVKLNNVGLKRAGFSEENLIALKRLTKLFYYEKKPLDVIEEIIKECNWGSQPPVQDFLSFAKASQRGISRATLLDTRKVTP